jgi:hypothetical protein
LYHVVASSRELFFAGTSVEPCHLQSYVDSECFRFNNRKDDDGGRFLLAVKGMDGKRLTYEALISRAELPPAGRDNGAGNANLPN